MVKHQKVSKYYEKDRRHQLLERHLTSHPKYYENDRRHQLLEGHLTSLPKYYENDRRHELLEGDLTSLNPRCIHYVLRMLVFSVNGKLTPW